MFRGEEFELQCYNYLRENYSTPTTSFRHLGGMDSTTSDIAVIKNNNVSFYIEAKDSCAQSGQFVVLTDQSTDSFVFSTKNHSEPNEMTDIIIDYMNQNFDTFYNAGTSGKSINISSDIFAQWIIQHYIDKGVKYFISYKNGFVILPIHKFSEYFDISAKYRIKKSGSREPAKKDHEILKELISNYYPHASFNAIDKKLYVSINEPLRQERFEIEEYTFLLSLRDDDLFEIRKLSNTRNMNVIFSIDLLKVQDPADLVLFENDIK